VELVWTVKQAPAVRFQLTWTESGGCDVTKPERRGFGSRLIEQVVAQDLSARTSLDFNATGVVCTIDAPASEVIPDGEIIEFPRVGRMGTA
jgi:two-component sensor histidine kinase